MLGDGVGTPFHSIRAMMNDDDLPATNPEWL